MVAERGLSGKELSLVLRQNLSVSTLCSVEVLFP